MSYNTAEKIAEWSSIKGSAHQYYEKPAIFSLVPDNLRGIEVLAIGCGLGEECATLAQRGGKIVGIDSSFEMVSSAREKHPHYEFLVSDFDQLTTTLGGRCFDFAFSSLALHYSPDLLHTFKEVAAVLNSEASFVFSIHHPVYWGASYTYSSYTYSEGGCTKTICIIISMSKPSSTASFRVSIAESRYSRE